MEADGEYGLPNRSSNGFGDAAVLAGVTFWRGVMSSDEITWAHKNVWSFRSKNFCVEVSRHVATRLDGEDENIWCIYAYIWKEHPSFRLFKKDESPFNQPHFEVHSYPSYYRAHINKDGDVMSHQIGWDYNHDGDSRYLEYKTKDDAGSVFWDAKNLIRQLKEWGDE